MSLIGMIPENPKINLYNYLLDLLSGDDNKGSSLYLHGVSHIIQELWAEIVQAHWRKLNVREFVPEKLGVCSGGLYACKNGKKSISIPMIYELAKQWQKLCGKNNQVFTEKWNKIFEKTSALAGTNGKNKTPLPRHVSPGLSYLIGWLCGDGHFNDQASHYLIKISEKSKNQLDLVLKPLFWKIFKVKPPIFNRYQKGWAIQVGSKPIFRFLTKVLDVKVGEIPSFINKLDKVNKAFFLSGIFDAEGYVAKDRLRITISQANKDFLLKLMKLFQDYGLKWNGPVRAQAKLGTWHFIHLAKKSDYLSFVNRIGSYHIDKKRLLEGWVRRIV